MLRRILAALALLIVLCRADPASARDELTGFWRASDGGTVEFFEDGTYYVRLAPAGPGATKFVEVTEGRYRIVEPGRIELTAGGDLRIVTYGLDGTRLTLDFPKPETYVQSTPPE